MYFKTTEWFKNKILTIGLLNIPGIKRTKKSNTFYFIADAIEFDTRDSKIIIKLLKNNLVYTTLTAKETFTTGDSVTLTEVKIVSEITMD